MNDKDRRDKASDLVMKFMKNCGDFNEDDI